MESGRVISPRIRDALAVVGGVTVVVGGVVLSVEAAKWLLQHAAKSGAVPSLPLPLPPAGKPVRVYIDGCFDMMHFGHCNAMRQARKLGDELVVGLVSDDEIIKNKGAPPLFTFKERLTMLEACKWVDEVIAEVPYDVSKEWVDTLLRDHRVDFIVHGDDPCILPDGTDAYAYCKSIDRFRMFKRTEGISTTDIVGRMLLRTREHHVRSPLKTAVDVEGDVHRQRSSSWPEHAKEGDEEGSGDGSGEGGEAGGGEDGSDEGEGKSFLPTSRRIVQFADGKAPKESDKIVYMHGSFDLFHEGHIKAMKEAKKKGDFLIVGLWSDDDVNAICGEGFPILNLYERALTVLACRFADEVIIGAPRRITHQLLSTLRIGTVVRGSTQSIPLRTSRARDAVEESYELARKQGILETIPSPSPLDLDDIIQRIIDRRSVLETRYKKKAEMEATHMKDREYVEEG